MFSFFFPTYGVKHSASPTEAELQLILLLGSLGLFVLALQVLHSPLLWSCRCLSYLLLQAVVNYAVSML